MCVLSVGGDGVSGAGFSVMLCSADVTPCGKQTLDHRLKRHKRWRRASADG